MAIVSGGVDSTTLLWFLSSSGHKISEILTFNYGQRHLKEIENAIKIAKLFEEHIKYKVEHQIVDISNIGNLISTGALTGDETIPHDTYDSENQRVTIVPNRNAILLNIAAGRAVAIKSNYIAYAAHNSDYSVYPDCRPEFIEQMDKAIHLGNLWTPVNILAPFVDMTKIDVVKVGLKLGVPYKETWSCYEGDNRPCLQCGTCVERTEAFQENGIPDPALSSEEWVKAIQYLKTYSKNEA